MRSDLVVSGDDIADMSGRELLEILNEDDGAEIAFILMNTQAATDLPPNAVVVPPGARVAELLAKAGIAEVQDVSEGFIDPTSTLEMDVPDAPGLGHVLETVAPTAPIQPIPTAVTPTAGQTAGQIAGQTSGEFKFENQGFIHLVRWLCDVTEFSCVEVTCGQHVGQVYFVRGALTHAEFGRQRGEDAIHSLFRAASDHRGGLFLLRPIDAATVAALPLSISKPITQIVLTWSA